MIAKDPAKYGFTDLEFDDPLSYDTVELKNPISMNKLAQTLNVDVEELKLLNPKFRGDFVPMSRNGETVVRIPVEQRDRRSCGSFAQYVERAESCSSGHLLLSGPPWRQSLDHRALHHHTVVTPPVEQSLEPDAAASGNAHSGVPGCGWRRLSHVTEGDHPERRGAAIRPVFASGGGTGEGEFHTVRRGET